MVYAGSSVYCTFAPTFFSAANILVDPSTVTEPDGGCDWTAGISACHAEASEGVKRL